MNGDIFEHTPLVDADLSYTGEKKRFKNIRIRLAVNLLHFCSEVYQH